MSPGLALRLLCVTAHPDDESLGFGGTLARYASEGIEVGLLVATRGERGRFGDGSEPHPGPEAMGRIREAEVREAAAVLGVGWISFLGYLDGALDQADSLEAARRVAAQVRAFRPTVVITFDPFGAYGHPDHVAIAQLTTAGVALAASAAEEGQIGAHPPHQVQKLYCSAWTAESWSRYQAAFKVLKSIVDGERRTVVAWPEWSVSTSFDARAQWETVWRAVRCHRTQIAQYGPLDRLTPDDHRALWGPQSYYRIFSLVNGGRARERDLFEGLREGGMGPVDAARGARAEDRRGGDRRGGERRTGDRREEERRGGERRSVDRATPERRNGDRREGPLRRSDERRNTERREE